MLVKRSLAYLLVIGFIVYSIYFVIVRFTQNIDPGIIYFDSADNNTGFPNPIVPNIVHLIHFGKHDDISFDSADNNTGFPNPIVPNIVHLIHFGKHDVEFGEVLAIRSAYLNHKPEKIIIHCDCHELTGKYWDLVKDIPNLEVRYKTKPTVSLNGKNFSSVQHASDVARVEILMEHGGIYLDSDVYVVSSLDDYRKFEFAIAWDYGEYLGTQVLVAHKNARFLKMWYGSYIDYDPSKWYYNAGMLPTDRYLRPKPYVVHRVPAIFGVHMTLPDMLYKQKTHLWKAFQTIHLLLRHRHYLDKDSPIKEFDLENIKTYNYTFGDMARIVLFGSKDII